MPSQPAHPAPARARRGRRPGLPTRAAVVGALVSAAAIAAPTGASADHYLGSTLSAAATVEEHFQQDTTFWPTAIPATSAGVPEDGQIVQFQLRGFSGGGFGPQPIHFQDLRPTTGGRLTVVASSSQFMLPATDGVWSFDPTNFCVRAGDVLAFNDEGGFGVTPSGVPFQVFGNVPGAQTEHFTKNNGVSNGDTLTPTALPPGVELLMAAYEGTGAHASPLCGGVSGIELHPPQGTATVGTSGTTTLPVGCSGPLPCLGTVTLRLAGATTAAKHKPAPRRRASSILGRAHFSIPSRHTGRVRIKLTARGRRLLRTHHGRLKVIVAVSAGAGTPADTTTGTLTLAG